MISVNVYGFGLYGEAVSITDTRTDSVNVYRLAALCNSSSSNSGDNNRDSSCGDDSGVRVDEKASRLSRHAKSRMSWGEDETQRGKILSDQFPWVPSEAFSFNWMRNGMREQEERILSIKGFVMCNSYG